MILTLSGDEKATYLLQAYAQLDKICTFLHVSNVYGRFAWQVVHEILHIDCCCCCLACCMRSASSDVSALPIMQSLHIKVLVQRAVQLSALSNSALNPAHAQ